MPPARPSATRSEIARLITGYLAERPGAQDTLIGIAEWWLLERQIHRETADVQNALMFLVAQGLVVETEGEDRQVRYRLKRASESRGGRWRGWRRWLAFVLWPWRRRTPHVAVRLLPHHVQVPPPNPGVQAAPAPSKLEPEPSSSTAAAGPSLSAERDFPPPAAEEPPAPPRQITDEYVPRLDPQLAMATPLAESSIQPHPAEEQPTTLPVIDADRLADEPQESGTLQPWHLGVPVPERTPEPASGPPPRPSPTPAPPRRPPASQRSPNTPYASSWEHVGDELHRLRLRLELEIAANAMASAEPAEATPSTPAAHEGRSPHAAHPIRTEARQVDELVAALLEIDQEIESRVQASRQGGLELRLEALVRRFGLDLFEQRCVVMCLATEADRSFERLYAHVQDDALRRRPTIDLVLSLTCDTPARRVEARRIFDPEAPLIHWRLVHVLDPSGDGVFPRSLRPLRLDDRVVDFLLGSEGLDQRLVGARVVTPQWNVDGPSTAPAQRATLRRFLLAHVDSERRTNALVYLHGPPGSGRRGTAESACGALGCRMLLADARVLEARGSASEDLPWELCREAILQSAAICLTECDELLTDEGRRAKLDELLRATQPLPRPTFLSGRDSWRPRELPPHRPFLELEHDWPDEVQRMRLWASRLEAAGIGRAGEPIDTSILAGKFRLTPGQMQDAIRTAWVTARTRNPEAPQVTESDLLAACRAQSHPAFARLARRIQPRHSWDDIVLPETSKQQLREICQRVERHPRVLGEWGFGRALSGSKGVTALFVGPSGTGKTMAAEIVADTLGLDLYAIDLSQVVSKWVGETEKHLDTIFTAAENANIVLHFDEADALFGKRSEVREALDRFANIEIAYLLQKMESYSGVAILSTNLRQNIDDAFTRRLAFTVEFPFPSVDDRRRIWEGVWPEATPRGDDVDLRLLATQYKLSGGNIRNVALASAYMAAANGGVVHMAHLLRATRREYDKLGMAFVEPDAPLQPAGPRPIEAEQVRT